MNSNQYTFISIFNFKNQECKNKFLNFAHSKNGLEITRNYKGCISINLYTSKNNINRLVLIQKWNSKYDKKCYLEMREKEGTHEFFNTLVTSPIELDFITPIDFKANL